MLSYQHGYHAGNFADVIKHLTLSRLLTYMTAKEKPLFYLDTHAGRGLYDLESHQALKTEEAQLGIYALMAHRNKLPKLFDGYFQAISQYNVTDTLRYYPGSPGLAITALREKDRLIFSELHPGEFSELNRVVHQRKCCKKMEGLALMQSVLPPPERRGLIFIDPSYELKNEYRDIPLALNSAFRRFKTGIYCLWYPLVNQRDHAQLLRGLSAIDVTNTLRVEFYRTPITGIGMSGCGLWIINPPYILASELNIILQELKQVFNPGRSSYQIGVFN